MAKDTVSIELLIENAGGAKSVSELKKAIKDLKNEAAGVDQGSKEFVKLTAAAAQAKNRMDDLNDSIRALNPEGKFAAFAKLGGTIASGFQAAQGAAALFGGESKELEKTLLKVQAATALSQGIQGLTDIRKQFELLGNVIKANPILLISTVVIALGVALYELKDRIKVVGDAFNWIGEKIGWVKDKILAFTDSIGLTNTAADKAAEDLEKRFERLIARGKEIDAWREKVKAAEEERRKAAKEAKDRQDKIDREEAAFQEKEKERRLQSMGDEYRRRLLIEKAYRDKKAEDKKTAEEQEAAADQATIDGFNARTAKWQEDQIRNTEYIKNAKLSIAQDTFNSLTALGQIFINDQKKLEKFNKAAALVQIGIDTAKAISALVSASQANPANAATSGIAGITQFASGLAIILTNIAKAKQILSSSGSSGSISLGGGGGGTTIPSSQPVGFNPPSTGETVPGPTGSGGKTPKTEPIRVYVTETDIRKVTGRIDDIQARATVK